MYRTIAVKTVNILDFGKEVKNKYGRGGREIGLMMLNVKYRIPTPIQQTPYETRSRP
jgi:hypothetical protein